MERLWPGENATCGENAGKLWMSRTTDAWNHRLGGRAWRSRGFIRPRRDLGDWLALVHFDDGGVSESYLWKTYAQRRCDFQNEALSQSFGASEVDDSGGRAWCSEFQPAQRRYSSCCCEFIDMWSCFNRIYQLTCLHSIANEPIRIRTAE